MDVFDLESSEPPSPTPSLSEGFHCTDEISPVIDITDDNPTTQQQHHVAPGFSSGDYLPDEEIARLFVDGSPDMSPNAAEQASPPNDSSTPASSSTQPPISIPPPSSVPEPPHHQHNRAHLHGQKQITDDFARDLAKLSSTCSNATDMHDTPSQLAVDLLPHQRQALAWMLRCESTDGKPVGHPRGGILADDQGFGKTLSLISLMLVNNTVPSSTRGWRNLIVAPTSVLKQWAGEFKSRILSEHHPKVIIYHGAARKRLTVRQLNAHDVVITSYGVLVQEYPKILRFVDPATLQTVERRRAPGPLFRVSWQRVVLDEAQAIKNRNSESHRAACTLEAQRHWAVSGTPIQNTVDDIYALFLFLQYSVVETHAEWKRRFKIPMEGGSTSCARRQRVFSQFQAILGPVLLRRAKHDRIDGKPVISLPERRTRTIELEFSERERKYYSNQEFLAVRRMNAIQGEIALGGGMSSALVILLRLRQACNHPRLCEWGMRTVFNFSDQQLDAVEFRMRTRSMFHNLQEHVQERLLRQLGPDADPDDNVQTCPVCMDIVHDGIVTKCGHVFCFSDFDTWATVHKSCPSCRTPVGGDLDAMKLSEVRMEVHAIARQRKKNGKEEKIASVKEEHGISTHTVKAEPKEELVEVPLDEEEEDDDDDDEEWIGRKRKVGERKREARIIVEDEIAPVDCESQTKGSIASRLRSKRSREDEDECVQKGRLLKRRRTAINDNDDNDNDDTETNNTNDRRANNRNDSVGSSNVNRNQSRRNRRREERSTSSVCDIGTSAKIGAFMSELRRIMDECNDKMLCFSQWTRMLDLVEDQLCDAGMADMYVRLDGSQSLNERSNMVNTFQTDPNCRLFLISLKAGSTGLNLTAANRVFLLDSWWNPAVEDQAIDRVHRIGQLKDVEIIKLKIVNTVEDRIFKLQEKKRAIADGALGKEGLKVIGRQQLSMTDILGLFTDVYENVANRAEQQNNSHMMDMVQSLQHLNDVAAGDSM